ncbi:MAG TPA: zinc ABC transporter substrate-binding protein [Alphaproteobacteria bacterium]|jgi:zinc transport system substrate-binding protein
MIRPLAVAMLAVLLQATVATAAAPPRVLATIKPLHSLAAGVMAGVGQPQLLMRATLSAHTYALKPSDAQAIQRADVIFWIGPGYESFMAKAMDNLPKNARVLRMSAIPGVTLLPTREGGVWEADDDEPDHPDAEQDMHLWLDPANAKAIAAAMADALGQADPADAARYAANAKAVAAQIDAMDAALAAELAPVKGKPFIVFHDGYQYYEKRYGLTAVGSITVTPDRLPGPRRLSALRKKVVQQGASCVFSEPQFTSSLVATVTEGTKARGGVLDPLGADAPDGPDGYVGLMRNLADSLKSCLLAAR